LTKDDLVIAISFRRCLRQIAEGVGKLVSVKLLRRGHDTFLSPLARIAHETFLASIETTSFGASYAAPTALFFFFFSACGQVRKAETMEIVREISEEQRHGSRWFQE
jgi:DNA-binding MurR/RpiR family transcriptional regulator